MRRLRSSVLRKYKDKFNEDDFCYAIDDTDNPKYGKNCYRVGKFHSHKGGSYKGQRVMVLALVDKVRNIAIPIGYAFCTNKDAKDHIPGHKIALSLMTDVLAEGFPKLFLVMDSWFDSVDLMRNLKDLGIFFVIEIRSNRLSRINPGPHSEWQSLQSTFRGASREYVVRKRADGSQKERKPKGKFISEKRIYVRNYSSPLSCIGVYNHKKDKNTFAYYVTNKLSLAGARMWDFSRARWCIEVAFRDLKQHLSFGRLPCTGKKGADISVCIPFILLATLRLDPPADWDCNEHDARTIGTMVTSIKERCLTRSIDLMCKNPQNKSVIQLAARRAINRINKKPINSTAESNKRREKQAA